MPKYTAKLTVPPENDNLNRVTADLKVSQGRIAQVTVTWSPGSQWLNALVVKYEGGQIIPSEGGGQCRGDGYPEPWPEYILLEKPHPVLNIEAWNEGNSYTHYALVDIIILPVEPDPMKPVRDLIDIFKKMMGL